MRYEKTVNGITTRQYLEGDRIIAEEILNASGSVAHTKYYIYDQTGIAGMVYDGDSYYFGKNIFGDVTTIYDCYGNWKASYEYDLWGNITSGGSSGIAKENPFRFRGYYYDSETGFYYLQSRYYDPEICRFINADNLELLSTLSGTPGHLNLYAYCNNNPVMYSDPSGHFSLSSIIICIAVSFLAELTSDLIDDGKINSDIQDYLGAILSGAIGGLGTGLISSAIFSGLGEVLSKTLITNEIKSFGEALLVFSMSAVSASVGYGIGKGVQKWRGTVKFNSIVGNSTKNIVINNKLANAGFEQLKIGVLGKSGVIDGIIINTKSLDIIDDIFEVGFGFFSSVRW